jgi:hypothetical protein
MHTCTHAYTHTYIHTYIHTYNTGIEVVAVFRETRSINVLAISPFFSLHISIPILPSHSPSLFLSLSLSSSLFLSLSSFLGMQIMIID